MAIENQEGLSLALVDAVRLGDGRIDVLVEARVYVAAGNPTDMYTSTVYQSCQLTPGSPAYHEFVDVGVIKGLEKPLFMENRTLQIWGPTSVRRLDGLSELYLPGNMVMRQTGWGSFLPRWSMPEATFPRSRFFDASGRVEAVRHPDGRLELFSRRPTGSIGGQGTPMRRVQNTPDDWTGSVWHPLYRPDADSVLTIAAALGAGDRMTVLGGNRLTDDGRGDLWRTEETDSGFSSGSWTQAKLNAAQPALLCNVAGRAEAFATRSGFFGGALYHQWQVDDAGRWSDWKEIPRPPLFLSDLRLSRPQVVLDGEGRVNVFALGDVDGLQRGFYWSKLWWARQNAPEPGSGWSTATQLSDSVDGTLTSALFWFRVHPNPDGRLEIWADNGNAIVQNLQTAGGSWRGWCTAVGRGSRGWVTR